MLPIHLLPTISVRLLARTGSGWALSLACAVQAAVVCPERPITLAFFQAAILYSDGQGLDKDIVDELQARSKCRFDTSVLPRARTWVELQEGRLDMTTSVLPTPEREQSLWIFGYLQLRNYLLLSKEAGADIKSLRDFVKSPQAPKLGVVRGFKHGEVYDAFIAELAAQNRVQEVVETPALYRLLKLGRVAAVMGTPMSYLPNMKELDLGDQVSILDWGGDSATSQRGLALSRRNFSEAQAREWQLLLDGMRRDGTIRRLLEKHLDKGEVRTMLLR